MEVGVIKPSGDVAELYRIVKCHDVSDTHKLFPPLTRYLLGKPVDLFFKIQFLKELGPTGGNIKYITIYLSFYDFLLIIWFRYLLFMYQVYKIIVSKSHFV